MPSGRLSSRTLLVVYGKAELGNIPQVFTTPCVKDFLNSFDLKSRIIYLLFLQRDPRFIGHDSNAGVA